MEHYSGPKGNEISSQKKTWKNLKYVLVSEISQSEIVAYCMSPTK